jgi:hypothetical protein
MGAILVGQMGTLSVRMERGARQEFAAIAERVRHASENLDAERIEEANQLLKALGDDPRANLKTLRKSPEGVNVLIDAWHDLTHQPWAIWAGPHGVTMGNLMG